jgi:hypothetical protein
MVANEAEIIHLFKYLILNYYITSHKTFSFKGYNFLGRGGGAK